MDNERHALDEVAEKSAFRGLVDPDWQITAILPGDILVERDCNSGATRRLRKSKCACGLPMLIEYNALTWRPDGKRIFYATRPDDGSCLFRCDCGKIVNTSVPGAGYDVNEQQPF